MTFEFEKEHGRPYTSFDALLAEYPIEVPTRYRRSELAGLLKPYMGNRSKWHILGVNFLVLGEFELATARFRREHVEAAAYFRLRFS